MFASLTLFCAVNTGCSTTQVMQHQALCEGCSTRSTRAPASRHYKRAVHATIAGMHALRRKEYTKASSLFDSGLSQVHRLLRDHPDAPEARHVRQANALAGVDLKDIRLVLLREMRLRSNLDTVSTFIMYMWLGSSPQDATIPLDMAQHHLKNGLTYDAKQWLALLDAHPNLSEAHNARRAQLRAQMRWLVVPEALKVTACVVSPGACSLEEALGGHPLWSGKKKTRAHNSHTWCQGEGDQVRQLLKASNPMVAALCALGLEVPQQRAHYIALALDALRDKHAKVVHSGPPSPDNRSALVVLTYTMLTWLRGETSTLWTDTFAGIMAGTSYKIQLAWLDAMSSPMARPSQHANASSLLTQLASNVLPEADQYVALRLNASTLDDTRRRARGRALVQPVGAWLDQAKDAGQWSGPMSTTMLQLYRALRRPVLMWSMLNHALKQKRWTPEVRVKHVLDLVDTQGIDALTRAPKLYELLGSSANILDVGHHTLDALWKTDAGLDLKTGRSKKRLPASTELKKLGQGNASKWKHSTSKKAQVDTSKSYRALTLSLVHHLNLMRAAVLPLEHGKEWSRQVDLLGLHYMFAFGLRVQSVLTQSEAIRLCASILELLKNPKKQLKAIKLKPKPLQDSYAKMSWRLHRALGQKAIARRIRVVDSFEGLTQQEINEYKAHASDNLTGWERLSEVRASVNEFVRLTGPLLDLSRPTSVDVARQIHSTLIAQIFTPSAPRVFENPEAMLGDLLESWSTQPSAAPMLVWCWSMQRMHPWRKSSKTRALHTRTLNYLGSQQGLSLHQATTITRMLMDAPKDRARVLRQWRKNEAVPMLSNPEILAWLHTPEMTPLNGQYTAKDIAQVLTLKPELLEQIARAQDVSSPSELDATRDVLLKQKMLGMCELLNDAFTPQEPTLSASLDMHRMAAAMRCMGVYTLEPVDVRTTQLIGGFELILAMESEALRAKALSRVYKTSFWKRPAALNAMYAHIHTITQDAPIQRVMLLPD